MINLRTTKRRFLNIALLGIGVMGCDGCGSKPPPPVEPPPRSVASGGVSRAPVPSALPASSSGEAATPPPAVPLHQDSIGVNGFGFNLYRELSPRPGNLAVSPVSLVASMLMTCAGTAGSTHEQFTKALGGPCDGEMSRMGELLRSWRGGTTTGHAIELRIANRLFGEKSYAFEETFLASVNGVLGASLEPLDFRTAPEPARKKVNAWVFEQTSKHIKDLLPKGAIDRDSRLVLVNAVYFNGAWVSPFDATATKPRPFHPDAATQHDVPTMHRLGGDFAEVDGIKLLSLPYAGDRFALMFLLPAEGQLSALEWSLTPPLFSSFVQSLRPAPGVVVQVPKFVVRMPTIPLRSELEKLGIVDAFTARADFTPMAKPGQVPLSLSNVFHQTWIDVNEKGTEAAAATASVVRLRSAPIPTVSFVADRPFLFTLYDRQSASILFLGRVSDPRVK